MYLQDRPEIPNWPTPDPSTIPPRPDTKEVKSLCNHLDHMCASQVTITLPCMQVLAELRELRYRYNKPQITVSVDFLVLDLLFETVKLLFG